MNIQEATAPNTVRKNAMPVSVFSLFLLRMLLYSSPELLNFLFAMNSVSAVEFRPETSRPISPKNTRFYRPELDALRFCAFFAVYGFHYLSYPEDFYLHLHLPSFIAYALSAIPEAGVFGVDLFFALSAYLITALLLREKDRFGEVGIRDFYIRRILRIWPLYFAFLLIATLPFVNVNHSLTWKHLLLFFLMSGNWAMILFGWPIHSVTIPLWTISIEEQFYLLWPPIVSHLSRRRILQLAVGMIFLSSSVRLLLVLVHGNTFSIWCNTAARLDPIAAGIILAILLNDRRLEMKAISRIFVMMGGISMILYASHWSLNQPASLMLIPNLLGFPLVAFGCALILYAVLGVTIPIPKPLVYLGKISYGLYVIHELGMFITDKIVHVHNGVEHAVLRVLVSLTITVLLAALSYHFLESPFLKLKDRFTRVASRPV